MSLFRKSFFKKILSSLIVITLIVIVIFIFQFVFSLRIVYQDSHQAVNYLLKGGEAFKKSDFLQAAYYFEKAFYTFNLITERLEDLNFLKRIPGVRREVQTAHQIFLAGAILSRTAFNLSTFASQILEPLQNKQLTLDKFDLETRRVFLKQVYQSIPFLYGTQAEINLAISLFESLPPSFITSAFQTELKEVNSKLKIIQQTITEAIPLIELFPRLAGYPQPTTYLLLFENNTELRPAGGFIGSYGILKCEAGAITSLFTDDSYNLDRQVNPQTRPTPPLPLKKYLGINRWYFRDANWSPDFKESAKKALEFYQEESGSSERIDGVIAITPLAIAELLKTIGPLVVDNQLFTSENFIDLLQWQVEIGYQKKEIAKPQRKAIIGDLSYQLIKELYKIPLEQWPALIQSLTRLLEEKQILLYSQDEEIQNFIEEHKWGGRLLSNSKGDYLSVVDANLGALKTDSVMEKTINYQVEKKGNDFIAYLKINYTNKGNFSWKTTRYRTYVRVYVPKGSIFLEGKGAMIKEKDPRAGTIEIGEELGKTVFGAFLAVEPGETKTLELKYQLPPELNNLFAQNYYQLFVQKQAGVPEIHLTTRINFGKKVKDIKLAELGVEKINEWTQWETKLRKDEQFLVEFW